ncbi:MAG: hypothetical protein KDD78_10310 [Caldilineaceae bacterium]|nr:hypothetical protein [Caldilineaceae bacterium]
MKTLFQFTSHVLQMRQATLAAVIHRPGGILQAAKLFVIVTLIAGLGQWFGLPLIIRQPLLTERIDQVDELVQQVDADYVPSINAALDSLSRANLEAGLNEFFAQGEAATAATLSNTLARAGIGAAQLGALLKEQTDGANAALSNEITLLLAEQGDSMAPARLDELMSRTALSADQLMALLQQSAARAATADLALPVAGPAAGLDNLLAQISARGQPAQAFLARMVVTPERVSELLSRVGLTAEQLVQLQGRVDAAPDQMRVILAQAKAEADRVEPPLGTRFSRVINLFGAWVATPFTVLAQWMLFGLVALLAAKSLGGRGTMTQHTVAMLLAAAPIVLTFMTYIPDLSGWLPLSTAAAVDYFGRFLALLGVAWSGLIVVRTLATAHEFSPWRAGGVLALTWFTIYVLAPVMTALAVGYILRG